ncbi:MAG: FkbM family methyltransferase [Dehalococcoidia bacterium]
MNNPGRLINSLRRPPSSLSAGYAEVAETDRPANAGGPLTGILKWLFGKLPPDFPEFVYTVLLRPWPLRRLTNFVIQKSLPNSVSYGPAVVMLNPSDPVVSGALAFRVYENAERHILYAHCRPGMTFVDIGANIGYYTALATHAVGAEGQVLALEPDPESFQYLRQTVAANNTQNVRCFQLAATDAPGPRRLYLSKDNRGDNRIYEPEPGWESLEIQTVTVDGLLAELEIASVDFIKIDVQGAEGSVIAGMKDTLRNSDGLVVMTEFWPKGLAQCGTDPMDFLNQLEELGLTLYELVKGSTELVRVQDKSDLISRYSGRKYGTVLALRPELSQSAPVTDEDLEPVFIAG